MMAIEETLMGVVVLVRLSQDLAVDLEIVFDYVEMELLIFLLGNNVMIEIQEVGMDVLPFAKFKMILLVRLHSWVILFVLNNVVMEF